VAFFIPKIGLLREETTAGQTKQNKRNKIMKTQTSFIKPLAMAMALAALLVATPVQARSGDRKESV